MLDIGDIDARLSLIEASPSWQALTTAFTRSTNVVVVGHGGNLAIADHIAVDISRLTNQTKSTFSPGSAIAATSFINDTSFEDWMVSWFQSFSSSINLSSTLVIGISSSGNIRMFCLCFLMLWKKLCCWVNHCERYNSARWNYSSEYPL